MTLQANPLAFNLRDNMGQSDDDDPLGIGDRPQWCSHVGKIENAEWRKQEEADLYRQHDENGEPFAALHDNEKGLTAGELALKQDLMGNRRTTTMKHGIDSGAVSKPRTHFDRAPALPTSPIKTQSQSLGPGVVDRGPSRIRVRQRPKPQNSRSDPLHPHKEETLKARAAHPHAFGGGSHTYKPANAEQIGMRAPPRPKREVTVGARELENEEMDLLDELHDLQSEVEVMEDELDELEERGERTAVVCESMQAKLDELVSILQAMTTAKRSTVPIRGAGVMKAWCEPSLPGVDGEGMSEVERQLLQVEMLFGVDDEYLEACLDPDPASLDQNKEAGASGGGTGTGEEGTAARSGERVALRGEEEGERGSQPVSPSLRDPATSSDKQAHSMTVAFADDGAPLWDDAEDDACPPKEEE
mmetsp:Transcript_72928/g.207792  ORF Transcript_72928/g.207792 Transcript_72928/m.207792 type:complete len:416 (+) Transcript_72928:509-1756(+)